MHLLQATQVMLGEVDSYPVSIYHASGASMDYTNGPLTNMGSDERKVNKLWPFSSYLPPFPGSAVA